MYQICISGLFRQLDLYDYLQSAHKHKPETIVHLYLKNKDIVSGQLHNNYCGSKKEAL